MRLAYDEARAQLLMFGGLENRSRMGDTWRLSSSGWGRVDVQGPEARNVHAMAYDPVRERVVLFGGIGESGRLDDLWEWNGSTWTRITPRPSTR